MAMLSAYNGVPAIVVFPERWLSWYGSIALYLAAAGWIFVRTIWVIVERIRAGEPLWKF